MDGESITLEMFVERACGHLESLQVWRDEAKRKPQMALLEAHACARCLASGWRKIGDIGFVPSVPHVVPLAESGIGLAVPSPPLPKGGSSTGRDKNQRR